MLIKEQSYPVRLATVVRHELGGVTTDPADDQKLTWLYQDLKMINLRVYMKGTNLLKKYINSFKK